MRRVLIILAVVVLLVCGGAVGLGAWLLNSTVINTAGKVDFVNAMPVPPLAESRLDDKGRRVFQLTAGAGRHDFGGVTAETWGFNGDYLGPTVRAARGEEVLIQVNNELPEKTSVHWHGMHLPAIMDGGPHQPVHPGVAWAPTWKLDQPAATLWYHPHIHGTTAEHVYRGLAGMFIVDDPATSNAALPASYGVDDYPVIVQDKRFRGDELDFSPPFTSSVGILGDTIVVNGSTAPYVDVTTERVRLRLLNGSNARVYDFGFADDRSFDLVATDGGLLDESHRTDRVMLSPGERAEIVVTMRPGERVVLRSTPPKLGLGFGNRFSGGSDTLDIMELRAAGDLAPSAEVPQQLTEIPRLDRAEAGQQRTFELSGHNINGRKMDMSRVDFTATVNAMEIWHVRNRGGDPHNFHVHDVQFQVLTVDGQAPPPELSGWKDTIYLPEQRRFELIMQFTDYTNATTPYMYHCHMLYHEDQGMMGQFTVVD